jgi:hypothetical protein
MRIFSGLIGLLGSKKACMSLIILGCATAGLLTGKLDGVSFAAIVGTIGTIYCWTAHKTDIQLGGKS